MIRARRTPFKLRKLLVVDHDPTIFRDLLTPYGFEVLTASSPAQALPIIDENPDILLLIVDSGGDRRTESQDCLRRFRAQRKESPVIAIGTARVEVTDPEIRPSVCLQKPVDVAELLDLVGLFCGLGTPLAGGAKA